LLVTQPENASAKVKDATPVNRRSDCMAFFKPKKSWVGTNFDPAAAQLN
jgi:hypothetical protein